MEILDKKVTVEQKRGLDIVDITADSPSPYEAALIVNSYAQQYRNLNLEVNRNQLIFVKNFLGKQKDGKTKRTGDCRRFTEEFPGKRRRLLRWMSRQLP